MIFNFIGQTGVFQPGFGHFAINNPEISGVTSFYIDNFTYNGANVRDYLLLWDDSTSAAKGYILIKSNENDDSTVAVFLLLGQVQENLGWVEIFVQYINGTSFTTGKNYVIDFYRTGDAGVGGSSGSSGSLVS